MTRQQGQSKHSCTKKMEREIGNQNSRITRVIKQSILTKRKKVERHGPWTQVYPSLNQDWRD